MIQVLWKKLHLNGSKEIKLKFWSGLVKPELYFHIVDKGTGYPLWFKKYNYHLIISCLIIVTNTLYWSLRWNSCWTRGSIKYVIYYRILVSTPRIHLQVSRRKWESNPWVSRWLLPPKLLLPHLACFRRSKTVHSETHTKRDNIWYYFTAL